MSMNVMVFWVFLCFCFGGFFLKVSLLAELVGFLAQTQILSIVHKVSTGLRSGLWENHPRSLMLVWFSLFKTVSMCVWGHCSVGTPVSKGWRISPSLFPPNVPVPLVTAPGKVLIHLNNIYNYICLIILESAVVYKWLQGSFPIVITNEKLVGLGLVKLNNIVEPSALLIKHLTECIYIWICV